MEERGRVNAEGNQRGHRKTESIVPMGRWGHGKDRLGEGAEDRDDLGTSKRTERVSAPKGLGRMFATSGEDRRGDLTS
jgi:hypothetical protein